MLDRLEQQLVVCRDPSCEWSHLSERAHLDRHNPPCAELFVGHDGTEMLCEMLRGHSGPHRGITRR